MFGLFNGIRARTARTVAAASFAAALLVASSPALASRPAFIQQDGRLAAPAESVAVSADGGTAIVGDPQADAAFVFVRSGGGWVEQAQLTPQAVRGGISGDQFGWSVALSAHGEVALVGAPGDLEEEGAAHVFRRSGMTWEEVGKLVPGECVWCRAGGAEPESGEIRFGSSVALSADGATGIVGAPGQATDEGAVQVVSIGAVGTGVTTELVPTDEAGHRNAEFGTSVAISGDGRTILAGGPEDGKKQLLGAAWVFTLSGTKWAQDGAKLTATGESGEGSFGESVALASDAQTALVAGPYDNGHAGAVWGFGRSGETWSAEGSKLVPLEESGAGHFGASMALSGNGTVALIGGPGYRSAAGAAWAFGREGKSWTQRGTEITPSGATGAAAFGAGVAVDEAGTLGLIDSPREGPASTARTFVTAPIPAVVTGGPSEVTARTAEVSGSVDPNGAQVTSCRFEYGTGSFYGSSAPCSTSPGAGETAVAVSASLPGLEPGAAYHYRIAATNAAGENVGEDAGFGTEPEAPAVVTGSAAGVTGASATLNATVNPNGAATSCSFEYGTSPTSLEGSAPCSASAGAGRGPVAVSAFVSGLDTHTRYYFRIKATNAGGTATGASESFETLKVAAAPTVTTGGATEVTAASAKVSGSVNPNGAEVTSCRFEFGTSGSYGSSAPCSTSPGAGETAVAVTASLSGLEPSATYHYRLAALNSAGETIGQDATLSTEAEAPTVVTEPADGVTPTSATLNATVDPHGSQITECAFEYGPTPSLGSRAACASTPGSGRGPVAVSASVTGLNKQTKYYFRISSTDAGGTSTGATETLETLKVASAPTVTTGGATEPTTTTAKVSGSVNPNGAEVTSCRFEYGASKSYGSSAPCSTSPGAGEAAVAVSASLSGLEPSATYHYRLAALNSAGEKVGEDASFYTEAAAPSVLTGEASAVSSSAATLAATVNPNGAATSCSFEYGTSPTSLENSAPCASPPGSTRAATSVEASITGLASHTKYYFRVEAANAGGASTGAVANFETASDGPPEFGRCLRVPAGTGHFADSRCRSGGGKLGFEWSDNVAGTTFETRATGLKLTAALKSHWIECEEHSTGEYTGPQTVVTKMVLTGCRLAGTLATCNSAGANEGEIVGAEVEGVLGLERAGRPALDLSPTTAGQLLMAFTCSSPAPATQVEVRGSMILPVKANKPEMSEQLKFKGKNGVQSPERLIGGPIDAPEASWEGAAYEPMAFSGGFTLVNGTPIENSTFN